MNSADKTLNRENGTIHWLRYGNFSICGMGRYEAEYLVSPYLNLVGYLRGRGKLILHKLMYGDEFLSVVHSLNEIRSICQANEEKMSSSFTHVVWKEHWYDIFDEKHQRGEGCKGSYKIFRNPNFGKYVDNKIDDDKLIISIRPQSEWLAYSKADTFSDARILCESYDTSDGDFYNLADQESD